MTSKDLKELCCSLGVDLVGIAPAERFVNAPTGYHPTDVMPSVRSVIVLATLLPRETLEQNIKTYTDIRNAAVIKMDRVAREVMGELKRLKHKEVPILSLSGRWLDGRFRSRILLKHAAELAGLGVVARNYLLINNCYGNLLWFTAVITSLELEPDPVVEYEVCNDCSLCVDNCPSGALANKDDFNPKSCRKVYYVRVKGMLELRCWQCRNVCPYKFGMTGY